MPQSKFEHVKVAGLLTVVPQNEICIYDEAQYYNNNVKKIDRAGRKLIFEDGKIVDMQDLLSISVVDISE